VSQPKPVRRYSRLNWRLFCPKRLILWHGCRSAEGPPLPGALAMPMRIGTRVSVVCSAACVWHFQNQNRSSSSLPGSQTPARRQARGSGRQHRPPAFENSGTGNISTHWWDRGRRIL
jgi:hypothetical protein